MDNRISILRLSACLLVVFLHASLDTVSQLGPHWWAGNVFDSFSRVCVPLFLMISGATLLGRSEPLIDFLKKRIVRIVLPLIFWSLFYLEWLSRNGTHTAGWFRAILSGPVIFHMWYLYAILGIYALVPLLRRFYQNSTRAEQIWVLTVWFAAGSLFPFLRSVIAPAACKSMEIGSIEVTYGLSNVAGLFGFLLLGAFLRDVRRNPIAMVTIYAIASTATAIGAYALSHAAGRVCVTIYAYQAPLVVIGASAIFCAFLSTEKSNPSRILTALSESTLGVYCLHIYVLANIHGWLSFFPFGWSAWLDIPMAAIATFVLCLIIVMTLRLIRPVRWIT